MLFRKINFSFKIKNELKIFHSSSRSFSISSNDKFESQMPNTNYVPPKYKGPKYEDIQNIRKENLTPNHQSSTYYKKPLLIHNGHMQWLFDHTGRRYLDMFGGIVTVSVGHCHPKINNALESQLKTLWHTTAIYMHPKIHEYAKKLTDKLPEDLKVVYFVNSGSEANDLAITLARLYTGNYEILTIRNGYHGMSAGTMGLTAQSIWRYPLPGINSGIQHVMNANPYLGLWGGRHCRDSPIQTLRNCDCNEDECEASEKYYQQVEEVLQYSLPRNKIAAFYAESIQGVGGIVQYPKRYIKNVVNLIRKNGGIYIADEVQTGFGRTGEHFWGFESHEIIPDIVTMAKGIGNGFPLGALVTTQKISEQLNQALHFNTYGGNPLACAVGLEVLNVIEEEELQKNSLEVGTYLLKGLDELQKKYQIIGDVRGKGLMIGVEFVANRETRTPLNVLHVANILEQCKDLGVLMGRGGINGNIFRIQPPMCITMADAKFTLDVLDKVLSGIQL